MSEFYTLDDVMKIVKNDELLVVRTKRGTARMLQKVWVVQGAIKNVLFDIEENEPKNWLRYRGCLEKVLKQLADIEKWLKD